MTTQSISEKTLIDGAGSKIELTTKIGTGGEGTVYRIKNQDKLVAKIYHAPIVGEKLAKLKCMVNETQSELMKIAAWPISIITDSTTKETWGFVMPLISEYSKIFSLYSPTSRKTEFPTADWSFLIHTAMNCAAAFDVIHSHGHVIGDVNQNNILVNKDGVVKLIDCDSFQISKNGVTYGSDVGVAEYTPPELHGKNFRKLQRDQNHDLFGLAVIVFLLLYMGRHPFAGRTKGTENISLEDAIKNFLYAYSNSGNTQVLIPPPNALPKTVLSAEISNNFEKSFSRGSEIPNSRPKAREWFEALQKFKSTLRPCQQSKIHKYPGHLSNCYWCAQENGGIYYFISTFLASGKPFAINVQILNEIDVQIKSIKFVPVSYIRPALPSEWKPATKSLKNDIEATIYFRTSVYICFLLSIILVVLGVFGSFTLFVFIGFFVMFWLTQKITANASNLHHEKKVLITSAKARLTDAENDFKKVMDNYNDRSKNLLSSLTTEKNNYEMLPDEFKKARLQLEKEREHYQQKEYLEKFLIAHQSFSKIGRGKRWDQLRASLLSFGIETAYDLDERKILMVPGFGPVYTSRLLDWKDSLLRKFKYDPSKGVSKKQIGDLNAKFEHKARMLEQGMRKKLAEAKRIPEDRTASGDVVLARIVERLKELREAEAVLR